MSFSIGNAQSFICRADSVRDIQFKSLTDEALKQYQQIIAADSAEDILIVQRQSGAIDQLEGIVETIDGEFVTFNFGGDKTVTSGTFTIEFPAAAASTAIIQLA